MAAASFSSASAPAIKVIAPFEDIKAQRNPVSIFLAGSIEMGKAPNWQRDVSSTLSRVPIAIYNLRRPPSFVWEAKNDTLFREQVDWEHRHLVEADIIAMFLSEETKVSISLLELDLFATSGGIIVCCEDNFNRLGNVD